MLNTRAVPFGFRDLPTPITSTQALYRTTDQFGRYHLVGIPGGAWERGRKPARIEPEDQVREVALWGRLPDWIGLAKRAVFGVVILYGAHLWFRTTSKGFADVL